MPSNISFFAADWPAPKSIRAYSTTRQGGVSQPPFEQLNLATHVEDDPQHVAKNRAIISEALQFPSEPCWLTQVHGTQVVTLPATQNTEADAAFSNKPGQVCVVMTADCLPVLFTNKEGTEVAAAHAGWRGLAAGVLEETLAKFQSPPTEILAWMGPAIGQSAFEVGEEVKAAFVAELSESNSAFLPGETNKWFADIYSLARLRLQRAGVDAIFGGDFCTYNDTQRFYSFRRDGKTGRMASLIWVA